MDILAKKLFSASDDEGESNNDGEKEIPNVRQRKEPMKVFLRIRPFTAKEISAKENQGCIKSKNYESVELHAPTDSFSFKSSTRGLSNQSYEFSFTHVFQDNTQQKEFFDETMLPFVKDILDGQNGLVFTYGVTNSGKTYTIQGSPKDGGILPRALDVIFNSVSKKLYTRANLKPKHCHDIVRLSEQEENREDNIRNAIFHANDKENIDLSVFKLLNSTTKTNVSNASSNCTLQDISIIQKSASLNHIDAADIAEEIKQRVADSTTINVEQQGNVKFGMWVSFMEIYNELMYDLLDLTPIGKGKKRATLKLGDDKMGKPYVKGLTEVFVTSSDEAYKVLRLGQRNRHMAATKLNQMSSRSHCIFTIKLLKIVDVDEPHVARISRLSIVDLAGSERYCKTKADGEQLKEASNINTSIMTLGKCISTLRYNQLHPNHPTIVPFRESKLTRLFQSFFLGKGKASMIVNVSQCASLFDETYHVMKFSAIAKQIKMKAERATELWKAPPLPKVPATPSYKRPPLCIITPATASKKRTLEDPTAFSYEELTTIVAELREKVKAERRDKAQLEKTIRKEVSMEMNELIVEIESSHNAEMMEQKQNLEETMEKRLDLLTKTVNRQRKRKKTEESYDESYVSSVLLHAEKSKVKERDEAILTLQARVAELESERNFLKKSNTPENHSKLIEDLKIDLDEAKETLNLQNDDMRNMQQKLQDKDDEIDKLREALEEDEQSNEQEKSIEELQQLLESTIKELEVARVKLDNRDKRIKELEKITEVQKAENAELVKLASRGEEWFNLAKEKNETLSKENVENATKLKEGDALLTKLKSESEELCTKLKVSEDNCKTIQFENDELSIKLEKYEALYKEHQVVLNENESIIEQLNVQVKSLKEQLSLPNICKEETDVVCKEEPVNEVVQLKENVETAEGKVKEYSEKVIRLEKQLQCYEAAAELKHPVENKSVDALKQFTTPIKKHNSPARSPFSPATKLNQTNTIKKLEKLLDETSKALEKKTNLVVTKVNRIQQLETKICAYEKKTGMNELIAERDLLKQKVNDVQDECSKYKTVISELQFQLENQKENGFALEDELTTWMKKEEQSQATLNELKNELKIQTEMFDNKIKQQQSLLEEKQNQLTQLKREESDVRGEVRSYEDKLSSMENDLNIVKNKLNTLQQNNKELTENLQIKNTDLENCKNEVNELKMKCDDKESIIEKLSYQQKNAEEKTVRLTKELEARRQSRLKATEDISDSYKTSIERLTSTSDDLQEENLELKKSLRDAQSKIDKLTMKYESERKDKSELQDLFKEKCDLEESLKAVLVEQTQKLDDRVQKLETQLKEEEKKEKDTNNKLIEKLNELNELKQEKEDSRNQVHKLERELELSEKEKADHFKTIHHLEQERTESQAIIDSLKADSSETAEASTLKSEVDNLQNQITQKDKEMNKYKNEHALQDEQIVLCTEESKHLKEMLALKEKELEKVTLEKRAALDEKRAALDELRRQAVKPAKRPLLEIHNITDSPNTPSDQDDPDFTPAKLRRIPATPFRKSTRRATKVDDTLNVKSVKNVTDLTHSDSGALQDIELPSAEEESFVCSVSVALSPFHSIIEEDEEVFCDNKIDLVVGNFVALRSEESDETPIIGKVVDVDGSHFTFERWQGGYSKVWKVFKKDGHPVHDRLHLKQILHDNVRLTNFKRLTVDAKRKLQTLYNEER